MSILDEVQRGRILVADGAWGTLLADKGRADDGLPPPGAMPEQWLLDSPETVREIGLAYAELGTDLLMTNTMGATRPKLASAGLADHVEEINLEAVAISRDAADARMPVFASVGPTGEFLRPLGTMSEREMIDAFAEQISLLLSAGAEGLVVETMFDLGEARAALLAAREQFQGPLVATMTFDRGPKGFATMMGVTPEQAAEQLQQAGADVVGSNCGHGTENMIEVIALMAPATDLPLWAKPNAGIPELVDGRTVFGERPREMASHFEDLVDAGARIIGGCCGTTPDHIRAFIATRDAMSR